MHVQQISGIDTNVILGKDPLIQHIYSKVLETIQNSKNVPGLKADEFEALKPGIIQRLSILTQTGVLEVTATDKDVRPYFVALQGIFEHVLSTELKKSIKSLTGVIHTPMPATPLCTEGVVSDELVNSAILQDPSRLFTVKARTTILRDYLYQGGDLFVAYPKDGLNKRNAEQQKIYQNALANYPTHLFDCPLACSEIKTEQIGAFYIYTNQAGEKFAFAIKMTQANNPLDQGSFGLWFGEIKNGAIQTRINDINTNVLNSASRPISF